MALRDRRSRVGKELWDYEEGSQGQWKEEGRKEMISLHACTAFEVQPSFIASGLGRTFPYTEKAQ